MSLKEKINSNPKLKKIIHWAITSSTNPKPRLWIKIFVNPFFHSKGKKCYISRKARLDVFPFNNFILKNNIKIEDNVVINNGVGDVIISEGSRIGIGCVLIGPIIIGKNVLMAQNIVISGLNHNYEDTTCPISSQGVCTNPIQIEENSWIGANVVIVSGVTIGKHCVVAAGCVVTKNIPPFSIVVGNPSRIVKTYNNISKKWERNYDK